MNFLPGFNQSDRENQQKLLIFAINKSLELGWSDRAIQPAVRDRNLGKRFGNFEFPKEISFVASEGNTTSIIGAKGLGNSTLQR